MPHGSKPETTAPVRRPAASTIAIYFSSLLVAIILFYIGTRGRTAAITEAVIHEIASMRSQIQGVVDSDAAAAGPIFSATLHTNTLTSTPEFQNLLATLRNAIQSFEHSGQPSQLEPTNRISLAVSKATLALAEGRATEALALLSEHDESAAESLGLGKSQLIQVLRLRADAFFHLQQWSAALAIYKRILSLQPSSSMADLRMADCLWALHQRAEALAAYSDVAALHLSKGDALILREKIGPGLEEFQTAGTIYGAILRQSGSANLALLWASASDRIADALMLIGNATAAVAQYGRSIEVYQGALESSGSDPANLAALASCFHDRGNALFVQRKLEPAINDYTAAADLWKQISTEGQPTHAGSIARAWKARADCLALLRASQPAAEFYDRALDLFASTNASDLRLKSEFCIALNNRAVLRRGQGNREAASADFSQALKVISSGLEILGENTQSILSTTAPGAHLDILINFTESETDISARTRPAPLPSHADLLVIKAAVLRNTAFAQLQTAGVSSALTNFQQAGEILENLVFGSGRFDLSLDYARTISPVAWILATSPADSIRNGQEARKMALKACAASDWQSHRPIEALAASLAELGRFDEAVKQQQRAVQTAPARMKAQLLEVLEIYKQHKSYRPQATASSKIDSSLVFETARLALLLA